MLSPPEPKTCYQNASGRPTLGFLISEPYFLSLNHNKNNSYKWSLFHRVTTLDHFYHGRSSTEHFTALNSALLLVALQLKNHNRISSSCSPLLLILLSLFHLARYSHLSKEPVSREPPSDLFYPLINLPPQLSQPSEKKWKKTRLLWLSRSLARIYMKINVLLLRLKVIDRFQILFLKTNKCFTPL